MSLITKNFRVLGIVVTPGSITLQLNGATVYDGPAQELYIDSKDFIATGEFTYEDINSPLYFPPSACYHTVVPCVINVHSGNHWIGLWEWDPTKILNPALPPECVAYYESWEPLPDDAPFAPSPEVDAAARAVGGWWVLPETPAWFVGGYKHSPLTRLNIMLNGAPVTISADQSIAVQEGDVLTYDLAIPNFQ